MKKAKQIFLMNNWNVLLLQLSSFMLSASLPRKSASGKSLSSFSTNIEENQAASGGLASVF